MAEFSYESDIAPLRSNNFRSGPIPTGEEYQRFLTTKKFIEDDLQAERSKLESERAQVAFESQKIQLEQVARASRAEREALSAVPKITQQLTEVMGDPSLDDTTKAAKIAELKFQYSGPITNSAEVKNLFTAADGTLTSRKENIDRSNNLAYTLIQSGQGDAAKKILGGRTDPMAANFMVAADAVSAAKKQESENKNVLAQRKAQLEMDKEMRSAQTAVLTDYMSTLRKIEPPKVGEADLGSLKTDGKTSTIPQAKAFKIPEHDKYEVQEMIRSLNDNIDEEKLKAASDEQLYRTALESVTGTLKNLAGFRSQFNRDAFRNKQSPPK